MKPAKEFFPLFIKRTEKLHRLYGTDPQTSPLAVEVAMRRINDLKDLRNRYILDPGCGRGTYLVKLYDKLFYVYKDIKDIEKRNFKIIQSIIGIEKEAYYVAIAKKSLTDAQKFHGVKNLLEPNIILGDFLKKDFGMKFDIILGNPPYQRPKGENKIASGEGNLFLDFIEKSSSLLKDGGKLLFIGPMNYLKPTNFSENTKGFSKLKGLNIIEIENGVEKYFNNQKIGSKKIGTFISLLYCQKESTQSSYIKYNNIGWDLNNFPFVFARGNSEMAQIFQKIWSKITDTSIGDKLDIRRIPPDKVRSSVDIINTPMVPRVYRSKEFEENGIIKWGNGTRMGNQTQIVNMSLSIEESNILFSSKMFRIIVYLSYSEPTIYHNFLNGIVKPKNLVLDLNTKDEDIMKSYGITPQLAEKIESII